MLDVLCTMGVLQSESTPAECSSVSSVHSCGLDRYRYSFSSLLCGGEHGSARKISRCVCRGVLSSALTARYAVSFALERIERWRWRFMYMYIIYEVRVY